MSPSVPDRDRRRGAARMDAQHTARLRASVEAEGPPRGLGRARAELARLEDAVGELRRTGRATPGAIGLLEAKRGAVAQLEELARQVGAAP